MRELGFGGLYRGVGVTFTRDAISAALFFATYGWAKLWLEAHGLDEGFLQKLLAGLAAGVPAAYFVTPIDVVKTRLQSGEPGLGAADVLRRHRPPHPAAGLLGWPSDGPPARGDNRTKSLRTGLCSSVDGDAAGIPALVGLC